MKMMMKYIRWMIVGMFLGMVMVTGAVWVLRQSTQDVSPPVISSASERIELSVKAGEKDLLSGLTAADQEDGDLTDEILIGGHSKFTEKGVFYLTYYVFDRSNNSGQYTREVHYTDYTSPKLQLTAPLRYQVDARPSYVERLTATDAISGDITNKIRVISDHVDASEKDTYTIEAEVANEYGDLVTLELPVHIEAASAFRYEIALSRYLVYLKPGDRLDPESYLVSLTSAGGNTLDTEAVEIEEPEDFSVPGIYEVTYSYMGSDGTTGRNYLIVVVEE